MPEGILTDLIAEGIISGIGGIVIFIPQIAFCFCSFRLRRNGLYESRGIFDGSKFENLG